MKKKEIKTIIIDYDENHGEIEKWLNVKGEQKYLEFAMLLNSLNKETLWKNVSDLYRYDKRILINNFRYFSFLEEYLRAILINLFNEKSYYDRIKKYKFNKLINEINNNKELIQEYFPYNDFYEKLQFIRLLRNSIVHNYIIII